MGSAAATLLAAVLAYRPGVNLVPATSTPDDVMLTVAALATRNAQLATRVDAFATENARQDSQLAALATEHAGLATRAAPPRGVTRPPPTITVTPWPAAPLLGPQPGALPCAEAAETVELRWSEPESQHRIADYAWQVERAAQETGPWHRMGSGLTSGRTITLVIECGAAGYYRWRVQARDVRGSIGPWSEYAAFHVD